MRDQDTIAAIATAHGRSAIGVIRVSGPQVQDIINEHLVKLSPRRATLAAFCDTDNFDLINTPSEVSLLGSSNVRFKNKLHKAIKVIKDCEDRYKKEIDPKLVN